MSFSSDNALLLNQLPISIEVPDPKDPGFLDILTLLLKQINGSVNTKENSLYLLQETGSFKKLFVVDNPQKTRNAYRRVFDLVKLNSGNISAGATVTFPHGISGIKETMMIYANCTSTEPRYFSIMNEKVYLTPTQVVFTNPSAAALTQCDVVAEYVKEA